MKILVTGANGFIGRHLSAHLISVGHTVSAVVRRTGVAPTGSRELVVKDIGEGTEWAGLLTGHDAIVHVAARVHVMNETADNPLAEFRRVNTGGTEHLARAAAQQGVRRFVFLSSIKVNGEGTHGLPYTAFDEPQPQDPYGVSKHEAEVALLNVQHDTGIEIVNVRTPLVYGPHVGGNFAKVLSLAYREVPLPLASVRNRRTMASVWNLVDLLEKCAADSEAAGALVLAGDSLSASTAQLFRELSAALGKRSRLFPVPSALLHIAGAMTGHSATIKRLTESLEVKAGSSSNGWRWIPPVTFADGIARTALWYLHETEISRTK